MSDRTDPLMAVTAALTDEQRQAVVDRFTRMNPHWRGAGAADILDALDQSDSDLAATEPFFDAHPDLIVDGAGIAARALIWSGQELTEAGVRSLLGKRPLGCICPPDPAAPHAACPVHLAPEVARSFTPGTEEG